MKSPLSALAIHAADKLPNVFEDVRVRGDSSRAFTHARQHSRMKKSPAIRSRRIRTTNVHACISKNILVSPNPRKNLNSSFYTFIEYDQGTGFVHKAVR